jgi:hypothetical protein
MARARAINPHSMSSQHGRASAEPAGGAPARLLVLRSGEAREALGRDGEKSSADKALRAVVEIPERVATLAKRSGRFAQVLAPACSSLVFGSDSRGREFFRRGAPTKGLDNGVAAGKIGARGSSS